MHGVMFGKSGVIALCRVCYHCALFSQKAIIERKMKTSQLWKNNAVDVLKAYEIQGWNYIFCSRPHGIIST